LPQNPLKKHTTLFLSLFETQRDLVINYSNNYSNTTWFDLPISQMDDKRGGLNYIKQFVEQNWGGTHFFDVREYFSPKCFSPTPFLPAPCTCRCREHARHTCTPFPNQNEIWLKKQDMIWLNNYFPHCVIWLSKNSLCKLRRDLTLKNYDLA
jgi:hypothetical protein